MYNKMVRRKYLINLITLYGLINAINVVNAQKKCQFPGSPAHSTVTFTDESLGHGSVGSYSCERGFELLGPSRRACENGTWVPEGIPFCVLNVAAGKAPMQISTEGSGIPQKAIDGSTSSFYSADTCSMTRQERVPWWYVNLLEPYMVQLVRLDFGKSCCGNNKPATIVVRVGNNRPDLGTNPICNRFTGVLEEGQPLFLPCNPPMPGAFVSVHLEVSQPAALSICEAFVYTDQALPIERCPTFRDQPPGALASYNGKCYIFYNRQPMNLRDSLAFCRSRGGTLITESNPALQGFISWELWRRHRSDVSSQYWMGAVRDKEDRNSWKWIGGDEVSVSFWNLPGGNEDCARYDGSKGWLWSDTNCNTQLNFICQHQPKTCGRPEQPPNSTMVISKSYEVGSTIEYTCDEGHLLIGPAQRTCLETGFYNEFPPVCKYIECGYPASIPHGTYELVNSSIGYLSQVGYKCNEGYEMLGRAMLTCDIDERWNGPPPRCEIIECDAIPVNSIKNGKVSTPNGTFFGSKAEIQCARGYKLDGPTSIVCTATGQWSAPVGSCVDDSSAVTKSPTPTIPATTFTRQRTSQTSRKTPTTSVRTSSRLTTTTQKSIPIHHGYDLDVGDDSIDSDNLPGLVREEYPGPAIRKPVKPVVSNVPKNNAQPPAFTTTTTTRKSETTTRTPQEEIDSALPEDNEVAGSNNNRNNNVPDVNIPTPVDNEDSGSSSSTYGAKLNLSSIIALSSFGAFVFLSALITTIVILVKRNRTTTQHYRHRASPDCNTVASFDSSSSESRGGLNRYYRQAWENLHESASKNHNQLRRKETLDPQLSRSRDNLDNRARDLDRSRENLSSRGGRDFGRDSLGLRDGSEMVVSDSCVKGERKRHHHHHHHKSSANTNRNSNEFRDQNIGNGNRNRHY